MFTIPRLAHHVVHSFAAVEGQAAYVLDCVSNNQDILAVNDDDAAAHCKSHSIKLYKRSTLVYGGEIGGHTATVSDLGFSPDDSNILCSSSYDGTVRLWDVRTKSCVHVFAEMAANKAELFCCALKGNHIAAGSEALVVLWDARTKRPLRKYEEIHTETVTQLKFHPQSNLLITASVDGLVCCVNTEIADVDEAITAVLNCDVSINKIAFFGPFQEYVAATTANEGVAAWNLITGDTLCNHFDVRPALSATIEVNYLIGCKYIPESNQMIILAGTDNGDLIFGQLAANGQVAGLGAVNGGHSELIRGFDWNTAAGSLITCAEDSRLCMWKWGEDGTAAAAASSSSPAAAAAAAATSPIERTPKHHNKHSYSPY